MSLHTWRNRDHPAYWASIVHRVTGILLALFLPLHFLALGTALSGAASLDGFLAWTERPWVKASEVALVALLAAHLTGGLRLLLIEFVGWRRESQAMLLAAAGAATACCALAFALKAAARWDAIEIAINVNLEQRRRMIAGSSLFQRNNPPEAKLAQIKTVDKSVNRANQIVLGHIVFKFGWEQTALAPINPFHEA